MITTDPGTIGENPAVIVMDPQVDFLEDKVAVDTEISEFAGRINKLVNKARENDIPIFWGKEVHRPDHADYGAEYFMSYGEHTIEDSIGEEYISELDINQNRLNPSEYIVPKRRFDLFFRTDLNLILNTYEIDTIIICGVTTHVCVHYTAHGGHNRDYVIRVVDECTADREEWKEIGLKMIEHLQPDSVIKLDETLKSFDQYSGNPVVKKVKETGSVFGKEGVQN